MARHPSHPNLFRLFSPRSESSDFCGAGLLRSGESLPDGALESFTFDDHYRPRTLVHYSFGDAAKDEASDVAKSSTANEDDVSIDFLGALAYLIDNVARENPRLHPYSRS